MRHACAALSNARELQVVFDRALACILSVPKLTISVCVLAILYLGWAATDLRKDTSVDAFLQADNPALVYRDEVKRRFGLTEPIVVGVVATEGGSVYRPKVLETLAKITSALQRVENVDPDRVISLATETKILGSQEGIEIAPFLEDVPVTETQAAEVRAAVDRMELIQGTLVSRDGSLAAILVEPLDPRRASVTYRAVRTTVQKHENPAVDLHVAGTAAVSSFLTHYIEADARLLNPVAGGLIFFFLYLRFGALRGLVLPAGIAGGSLAGSLGAMSLVGEPFYPISNGLIAILLGISVADAIHVLIALERTALDTPEASRGKTIRDAYAQVIAPISVTTLTTVAGFSALAIGADMPPVRAFGAFAAVGVAAAWLFTLTMLPAAHLFIRFDRAGPAARLFTAAFAGVARYRLPSRLALIAIAALAALGLFGAAQVQVDEAHVENFAPDTPIYEASEVLNARLAGTYFLDVVVEGRMTDAFARPETLKAIEELQVFGATLAPVGQSVSIVDYIKKANQAVHGGDPGAYRLPDRRDVIAQLLLLYTSSADPRSYGQYITQDYSSVLVRFHLPTGRYSDIRLVVEQFRSYVDEHLNTADMKANVTGRVALDYHWMRNIERNHYTTAAIAFLVVAGMVALLLRSWRGALCAMFPVAFAVLGVYATMGFLGIWLGVGTSMSAAIAIGLAVDFGIHMVSHLRTRRDATHDRGDIGRRPNTYEALAVNALAIATGFACLGVSHVRPVAEFGLLVFVAVTTALVVSLVLLPAVFHFPGRRRVKRQTSGGTAFVFAATAASLTLGSAAAPSEAAERLSAAEVVERVNDRAEGRTLKRDLTMELISADGSTRTRKATVLRRYNGDTKELVVFFTAPANIAGTAFLTYDYADPAREDDQWMYLPALRKVRRISASDRGDSFFGTNFSYEDVKKGYKIEASDYVFSSTADEGDVHVVEGSVTDSATASEVGHKRAVWRIDGTTWLPVRERYFDVAGNPAKEIRIERVANIQGFDTPLEVRAENLKTGHVTQFTFDEIAYNVDLPDRLFNKAALRRGLR